MPHFLFAAMLTWGHLRPELALALNLLNNYPDLHITFVSHLCTVENITKEIENFAVPESVVNRLKIDTVGTIIPGPSPFPHIMQLFQEVSAYIQSQIQMWTTTKGQKFDALPSLIVTDMFLSSVGDAVKSTCAASSITEIPIFMFEPSHIASHLDYFAPGAHTETFLKRAEKWKTEDPATYAEMSPVDLLFKAFIHSEGQVVDRSSYTGLQPIYDYEFSSDVQDIPPMVAILVSQSLKLYKQCQGVVLPFASELEPGLVEKTEELFGPSHTCLAVGPQFSPKFWNGDFTAGDLTPSEQECIDFLNAAEIKYGQNSVLYISFGSLFFPDKKLALVYTLIESLIAAKPPVPFLFSMAGAPPDVASGIVEFVASKAGGIGKISSWTPQAKVLNHNATGWFLTHGGSNSMSEALLTSVPLIFWPMAADQFTIASELTLNLKISYELMQVRTGRCVGKPTYRGITPLGTKEALAEEFSGLWEKIRGPDGEATRKRVEETNAIIRKSHTDGASKQAMKRFERFM